MPIDRSLNYGRHLIKKYLEKSTPFSTVLDLGAGPGIDLRAAALVSPQAKLHAVEVFPPYATELTKMGISVHDLNIECFPLPFSDASLDVIIANQVLEHTKEIFWIFHEVSRVLKTGGKLIIGVPNLASLHNRLLLAIGSQPSSIKTASAHIRGFTKKDLIYFIDACFPGGYSLQAFGGSNFYPFSPFPAKLLARTFPSFAWGIFLLLEKKIAYDGGYVRFPASQHLESNFYLGA